MGSEISKKDITRLGFRSSLLQASFKEGANKQVISSQADS
ncbi:hypothetical protein, partial [Escherichia coli]